MDARPAPTINRKYWEIIADNLSKAGWSWGCVSALDSKGEQSGLLTHTATTEGVSLRWHRRIARLLAARMAARRRLHGSVPLIERDRALKLRSTSAKHPGPASSQSADGAGPRCSTQRAGIAPPHAEGDGLSGATSDRETFAFISGPAGVVGGVPLTRARIPWAMPEAST